MGNVLRIEFKTLALEICAVMAFSIAIFSFDPTLRANDIVVVELFDGLILFVVAGLFRKNRRVPVSDIVAIATVVFGLVCIIVGACGLLGSSLIFPTFAGLVLAASGGAYFVVGR